VRATKSQLKSLLAQLELCEVDGELRVGIYEDPARACAPGSLRVTVQDRWLRETLRIERDGSVTRPTRKNPSEAQIPGQIQIEVFPGEV
jgi:hypothetical protein